MRNFFTCAGRSSCSLTGITVQLSSGSRVTLMLATVAVVILGFCVSVFLCVSVECLGSVCSFLRGRAGFLISKVSLSRLAPVR